MGSILPENPREWMRLLFSLIFLALALNYAGVI